MLPLRARNSKQMLNDALECVGQGQLGISTSASMIVLLLCAIHHMTNKNPQKRLIVTGRRSVNRSLFNEGLWYHLLISFFKGFLMPHFVLSTSKQFVCSPEHACECIDGAIVKLAGQEGEHLTWVLM